MITAVVGTFNPDMWYGLLPKMIHEYTGHELWHAIKLWLLYYVILNNS